MHTKCAQKFWAPVIKEKFPNFVTIVVNNSQHLWSNVLNISCVQKFWTEVVKNNCEQKVATTIWNKSGEIKFETKDMNKIIVITCD